MEFGQFMYFLEDLGQKSVFGTTIVFHGQEKHHFMVYIAHYTEFNLGICSYAQKLRSCHEDGKYGPNENFCSFFLPSPKGSQLLPPCWLMTKFLH